VPCAAVQCGCVIAALVKGVVGEVRSLCGQIDRRTAVVLLTVPVLLTWLEFFGARDVFLRWFPGHWGARDAVTISLRSWEWWGLNCVMTFWVVPALIVKVYFRQNLAQYGITMPAPARQIPLALGLYLLVFPFILGASRSPTFQSTYPMFAQASLSISLFLTWEAVYLAQFFSLEFFFRGFMLFGLEPKFGPSAVLVTTIPYCMVHYHKPVLEAYAAIVAGLVLGTVALRTRSIWSGFLVHSMVAVTMDLTSLLAQGWRPAVLSG